VNQFLRLFLNAWICFDHFSWPSVQSLYRSYRLNRAVKPAELSGAAFAAAAVRQTGFPTAAVAD